MIYLLRWGPRRPRPRARPRRLTTIRRVSPPLRIVIVPAGTAKPFDENWIVTLLMATAPSTRRCGPSTVCASAARIGDDAEAAPVGLEDERVGHILCRGRAPW